MSKKKNDGEGSSLPPTQMICEIMQEVKKVPKPEGDDYDDLDSYCWIFPGSGRYGQKRFNGKRWAVHQAMLEYALQEKIPEGLEVRHRCDVSRCCNPAHLMTGTTLDNALDREIRKRVVLKGEDHPLVLRPECRSRGEKHYGNEVSEETKMEITRAIEVLGTDENVILSIAVFHGVNRDVVDQLAEGARDEK